MDRPYAARRDHDTHTLAVEGVLDEVSTPRFRDDLMAFVDEAAQSPHGQGDVLVSVELSEVEYLLSVAIAALAAAKRHADDVGAQVRFVAAAGSIAARILEICGLPYDLADTGASGGPGGPGGGDPA